MTSRNLVGLVYNSQVPEAADLVRALVQSLDLRGRCWVSSAGGIEDVRDRLESTKRIVVAGGDGTILRAVRVIAPFSIPIVGINLGRVGFLTELTVSEAAEKLPAYLDGDLRVEERMMVQASVIARSEDVATGVLHALNDVVVGRGDIARLLDIDASVDGVPLASYRADAVIVSTATGSTGYALSAGGPVLYPEARQILVQPVAAYTGLRDGLILPEVSAVELGITGSHRAMLSVDGFSSGVLHAGDRVIIGRSPYTALFLRSRSPSAFYASLMQRLGLMYRSGAPSSSA